MRYAIITAVVVIAAFVGGMLVYVVTLADDPHPEVLSGTELTIEDWQECLAFLNEGRAARGEPTTTTLPTLIDGEWRFAGAQGGDFYSCGR